MAGKKRIFLKIVLTAAIAAAGLAAWLWATLPDVADLKTKNPDSTSFIRRRLAESGKKAADVRLNWIAFQRIPRLMKRCVLVSEDAAFYDHKGIDFTELRASIEKDIKEGRLSRGGSTITQQLAKNLYLTASKSLVRKLREAFIARRLEKSLTKDRIFHLYLNVIEWGPGIFGLSNASRRWFGKDPADLTLEEMVRLTAIIPRPLRSDPRKNDAWMKFKGRWIADTLRATGDIGPDEHTALLRAFE